MLKMWIAKEMKDGVSYTTVNEVKEDEKSLCKFDYKKGMIDFTPIADFKNEPIEIHDNDGFSKMNVLEEVCVDEEHGGFYLKLNEKV